MGIPTLISTNTATGDSSLNITAGIDGTYDEYMFLMVDMQISVASQEFQFNVSSDGGSNYNVTKTTTRFFAHHKEDDSGTPAVVIETVGDQAQATANHYLTYSQGAAADESASGILTLYTPSNTTYAKHFTARMQVSTYFDQAQEHFSAGYFNTTSAINAISFVPASGTLNGVIQMFGIA